MSTQTIPDIESATVAAISQNMKDLPHWQKPLDRLIQQSEFLENLPDNVRQYMRSGQFRHATHLYVFKGRAKRGNSNRCEIIALVEVVFDETLERYHPRHTQIEEGWHLPVSRRLTEILGELEEKQQHTVS